jgi:hypothetical protein
MKNLIKLKGGEKYIEYNSNKSIMESKNNLLIYSILEKVNLEESGVKFPFFYTIEYKFLPVNRQTPILNQIYTFLNSLYKEFSSSQFLIVKLYFDVVYEVLEFNIYPIISKKSSLGEKIRLKCSNEYGYLNLCLLENPSDSIFSRELKYYSLENKRFLDSVPYLNCGIFKYDENGQVNKFNGWEGVIFNIEEDEITKRINDSLTFKEDNDNNEEDYEDEIDF